MKHHWPKIIEWSEVDEAYVGSIPGLVGACCHGDDEQSVLAELCRIQEEAIEAILKVCGELPPSLPPLYMLDLSAGHPLLRDLDPDAEIAEAFAWLDKRTKEREDRETAEQLLAADGVQEKGKGYHA